MPAGFGITLEQDGPLPNTASFGVHDVAQLANRGFVTVGSDQATTSYITFYDSAGVPVTTTNYLPGIGSTVDQLINGNVVVAGSDASGAVVRVLTGTGARVSNDIRVSTSATAGEDVDVTALANGGFAVGYVTGAGADRNIALKFYSSTGVIMKGVVVDSSAEIDEDVSIAGLDGGGIAVSWTRRDALDGSTQVFTAVYSNNGTVVAAPALVANGDTIDSQSSIVATPDGGYAIAYTSTSVGLTSQIIIDRYTAAGEYAGRLFASNHSEFDAEGDNASAETAPHLSVAPDGRLIVTYLSNDGGGPQQMLSVFSTVTANGDTITGFVDTVIPSPGNAPTAPLATSFGIGQVVAIHFDAFNVEANLQHWHAWRDWVGDEGNNNDSLVGDDTLDIMNGQAGNDVLRGMGGDDELKGDDGIDILYGGDGNDVLNGAGDLVFDAEFANFLFGEAGNDLLLGTEGDEEMDGGTGNDILIGNDGNDLLFGGLGADKHTGGANSDTFVYKLAAESFDAGSNYDTITDFDDNDVIDLTGIDASRLNGGNQDFTFIGYGSQDRAVSLGQLKATVINGTTYLMAGTDNDGQADFILRFTGVKAFNIFDFLGVKSVALTGTTGADTLLGGDGDDRLTGGLGIDRLIGNGGKDVFVYTSVADSPLGSGRDIIEGWESGLDKIDLKAIDARASQANDQAFTYGGGLTNPSTNAAEGVIRYYHQNGNTFVIAGTDADAPAELQIQIAGIHTLTAANFIL